MSIQYNVDISKNSFVLYDHTAQYSTNDKYSVYDASTNARVTMNVDGTLTGNVSTANFNNLPGDPSQTMLNSNNDLILRYYDSLYIVYNGTNTAVHLAGDFGNAGYLDGNGTNALLNINYKMTIDGSNNIYVIQDGKVIRKIDLSGNVTTIAGDINNQGYVDGNGTNARFSFNPFSVSDDVNILAVSNNIYILGSYPDANNDYWIKIRKIDSNNNVTTFPFNIANGNDFQINYDSFSYYNDHLYFSLVDLNSSDIIIKKMSLIDNSISTVVTIPSTAPYWPSYIQVIPSGPYAGNFISFESNQESSLLWIDLSGNYGILCGHSTYDGIVEDGLGTNAGIGYLAYMTISKNSNLVYLTDSDNTIYLRKIDLYPGSVSNAAGPTQVTNVLSGNFLVNSTTNAITAFYNNNAPSTNILLTTGNTNGADYIYSSGNFSSNGTTISSISTAVDTEYGASGWLIYYDNATSTTLFQYKNASNAWVSVPSSATTFSIMEVLDNQPPNNVPCFNQGTKILCLNKDSVEEYVPVENLRKGDLVKTYLHGYKKIKAIGVNRFVNDPSTYRKCMYLMKKEKNAGLIEDLTVTGDHSILVDNMSFPERMELRRRFAREERIGSKKLVMSSISSKFEKKTDVSEYTYYHFCVEDDKGIHRKFGVWSNGILSEIPSSSEFNLLELNKIE
jgi:hypothetical protein